MLSGLDASSKASADEHRQIRMPMSITVFDFAREKHRRSIQRRNPIAFVDRIEFAEQVRELFYFPAPDFREFVEILLDILVVRNFVVPLADRLPIRIQERITPIAARIAEHERHDACRIALYGKRYEVQHHFHVFRIRQLRRWPIDCRAELARAGFLDFLFQFTDARHVFVELAFIGRPEFSRERIGFAEYIIQHARVIGLLTRLLLGRGFRIESAEKNVPNHLGIDGFGQRLRF